MPESVLETSRTSKGASEPDSLLNTFGLPSGEIGYLDLALDIRDLIDQRGNNAEIIAALGLASSVAKELIEYIRQRHEDPP